MGFECSFMRYPRYKDLDANTAYATYRYAQFLLTLETCERYKNQIEEGKVFTFKGVTDIDEKYVCKDADAIQFYKAFIIEGDRHDCIEYWHLEGRHINLDVRDNSSELLCSVALHNISLSDIEDINAINEKWFTENPLVKINLINGVKYNEDGSNTIIPLDAIEYNTCYDDTLVRSENKIAYISTADFGNYAEMWQVRTDLRNALVKIKDILSTNDYYVYYCIDY